MKKIKKEINITHTQKGDLAYVSTLNACLDFFGLVGGFRHGAAQAKTLFNHAFNEDPNTALKILFYVRDIRGGLGERNLFRQIMNNFALSHKGIASLLIPYIPVYGRWDDLLCLENTPVWKQALAAFKLGLSKEETKYLVAKWLPSVNASNKNTIRLGREVAWGLGMTEKEYRRMLSALRQGHIIENNLRTCDYSFDYGKVPAKAMHKYRHAFMTKDLLRYQEYLDSVIENKSTVKVEGLYPYEIIREVMTGYGAINKDKEVRTMANLKWEAMKGKLDVAENTVVVRDGSGSMYQNAGNLRPIDVATSLAILMAEKTTGFFHNKFITFSRRPELVDLKNGDFVSKVKICTRYEDCDTTNISGVFEMILNIQRLVRPEERIKRLIVVSDMEFDNYDDADEQSTYDCYRQKFADAGMELPKITYLNVNAAVPHFPASVDDNVQFISGFSAPMCAQIIKNGNCDAVELMNNTIAKYGFIDDVLKTA